MFLSDRKIRVFLCAALALFLLAPMALSEAGAPDIRLARPEGAVTVLEAAGQPLEARDGLALTGGETVITGEASRAAVAIGDERTVYLDSASQLKILREGLHLRLALTGGTLLMDVRDKLGNDERLEIQTDDMTVSIRGTIVYVSGTPADQPGDQPAGTVLGVLEGAAQITYQDENGTKRELTVPAGRKLTVDGSTGIAEPAPVTPADLDEFLPRLIPEDNTIIERIDNQEDILSPEEQWSANGDWVWTDTVTIVAPSASKVYDGTPLTARDAQVIGLPAGFSVRVTMGGSQTNAGTSQNHVASYFITNRSGEDVTGHFRGIEIIKGTLVVEPAPMTIWTGSAEKRYDGTPLTSDDTQIRVVPGYRKGDPPWRNVAWEVPSVFGNVLYGVSGVIPVTIADPVSGAGTTVTLRAGECLKMLLPGNDGNESISTVIETVPVEDLPEDVLRLYANNPELLATACADAGWEQAAIAERIAQLPPANTDYYIQHCGLKVPEINNLIADASCGRIIMDSGSAEIHFTPIGVDPSIRIRAAGSQTEVGQSPNTYEIDWGTANPNNYILTEDLGTLTVYPAYTAPTATPNPTAAPKPTATPTPKPTATPKPVSLSFSLGGGTFRYGDTFTLTPALTVKGKTIRADSINAGSGPYTAVFTLPDGNTATLTAATDFRYGGAAGTYTLKGSVRFSGSAQYQVSYTDETVTVTPAELTVTTGSAQKTFDGTALTCSDVSVMGLVGKDAVTVTATGSLTDAGTADNTYAITWGKVNRQNYTITENLGTLTVTKRKITFDLGGCTGQFSGDPLLPKAAFSADAERTDWQIIEDADEAEVGVMSTFTLPGGQVRISCRGFTDAGSYTLSAGEEFLSGKAENYDLNYTNTGMTITPMPVTVSLHDGTDKEYNGEEQIGNFSARNSEFDIGYQIGNECGFVWGSNKILASVTGGRDAGSHTLTCTFSSESGRVENFAITVTDTALTILPAELAVTTGSAIKEYDGKPLTCGETSVAGLCGSDNVTVTAAGALTDIGSVPNDYTVDWGGVNPDNYSITEELGTLEVTKNYSEITVVSASASNKYWPFELTDPSYTVEGLPDGLTLDARITGSQRLPGSSENTIAGYTIRDGNGAVVTDNFAAVTLVPGTLTVTKATVTVFSDSPTYAYTGTPQVYTTHWQGIYNSDNPATGVRFSGYANPTDAGTHQASFTAELRDDLKDKYEIGETVFGTVTILPVPLTITTGTAEKTYDGIPLTCADVSVIGLAGTDAVSVSPCGSQTDVGTAQNEYTIDWGSVKSSNYTITENPGTLTVTPADMTITTGSASKAYDGGPLTCGEASVTGLVSGETAMITAIGSLTDVGMAENGYTIEWVTAKEGNYSVTEALGTLTVSPNTETIEISAASVSKAYDGSPLTAKDPVVTGLPGAFRVSAAVEGSQTDVGESDNIVTSWSILDGSGKDVSAYFTNVTTQKGHLTVTANSTPIVITAASASKAYDGSPLTAKSVDVRGLPGALRVTAEVEGSQTNVGDSSNIVTSWTILDGSGKDVSRYFTNVTTVDGKLTVFDNVDPGPGSSCTVSFDKNNYTITIRGQGTSHTYRYLDYDAVTAFIMGNELTKKSAEDCAQALFEAGLILQ